MLEPLAKSELRIVVSPKITRITTRDHGRAEARDRGSEPVLLRRRGLVRDDLSVGGGHAALSV